MSQSILPRPVVILGLAGIAPQAICLALALTAGPYHWIGISAGCFYAAAILSFLGGMWWMAGILTATRWPWLYLLAVFPSLAAWGALLPWIFGWRWPVPSLLVLGIMLLASPLADAGISRTITMPRGWLTLRSFLAAGLGLLTIALGLA